MNITPEERSRCEKYYGAKTDADCEAVALWEIYYDLYKDAHDVRPRWTSWTDRSAAEWREVVDRLCW